MLSAKDAFNIVREHTESDVVPVGCREYKNAYSFLIGPPGSRGMQRVFTGRKFYVVLKGSGIFFTSDDPRYAGLRKKPWRYISV